MPYMEDTYNIKAIVLNRQSYLENDGRVMVYSRETGKLELTVRGAKKIKSKLAGHLEPMNLVDIMAVRGQRRDYVGAAVSDCCYGNIKNDLAKLAAAGRAMKIVDQLIKPGLAQAEIFELLKDYLEALEGAKKDLTFLASVFIIKFLARLGHQPELSRCLSCGTTLRPGSNRFDLARGGLVCAQCAKPGEINQLAISNNGIKLLRLALKCDFAELAKVKVEKKLGREVETVIEKFLRYGF